MLSVALVRDLSAELDTEYSGGRPDHLFITPLSILLAGLVKGVLR